MFYQRTDFIGKAVVVCVEQIRAETVDHQPRLCLKSWRCRLSRRPAASYVRRQHLRMGTIAVAHMPKCLFKTILTSMPVPAIRPDGDQHSASHSNQAERRFQSDHTYHPAGGRPTRSSLKHQSVQVGQSQHDLIPVAGQVQGGYLGSWPPLWATGKGKVLSEF